MTRMVAASPTAGNDAAGATGTARWEALFGCAAPQRLASLIEQAVAWREQVLAHGDVSAAIAHDLRLTVEHARQQRGATLPGVADPVELTPVQVGGFIDWAAQKEDSTIDGSSARPAVTSVVTAAAARSSARGPRAVSLPPAASQLLPGSQLVKAYGGRNHVVAVREDGFAYEGAHFASLSAVARHITGTHWNGLLFFGLRKRRSYPPRPRAHGQAAARG